MLIWLFMKYLEVHLLIWLFMNNLVVDDVFVDSFNLVVHEVLIIHVNLEVHESFDRFMLIWLFIQVSIDSCQSGCS